MGYVRRAWRQRSRCRMSEATLTYEVRLGGEALLLHAERAVIWQANATLIVADVHLGKEGVFAAHGVAVPRGPSACDLQRLGQLVAAYACTRVLVLGDLFHGHAGVDDLLLRDLAAWREARPGVALLAIAGNHDTQATRRRSQALVQWCEDGVQERSLAFRHVPGHAADVYSLAGHVHPTCRISGHGRDLLRLPVFWQQAGCLVLPAFGSFTGGCNIRAAAGERLYAAGPGAVVAL
jgi:uncharacterized protein